MVWNPGSVTRACCLGQVTVLLALVSPSVEGVNSPCRPGRGFWGLGGGSAGRRSSLPACAPGPPTPQSPVGPLTAVTFPSRREGGPGLSGGLVSLRSVPVLCPGSPSSVLAAAPPVLDSSKHLQPGLLPAWFLGPKPSHPQGLGPTSPNLPLLGNPPQLLRPDPSFSASTCSILFNQPCPLTTSPCPTPASVQAGLARNTRAPCPQNSVLLSLSPALPPSQNAGPPELTEHKAPRAGDTGAGLLPLGMG